MEENMTLSAFFKENAEPVTIKRYVASERFKQTTENGKKEPIEWRLRALTNDEIDTLRDKYKTKTRDKNTQQIITEFDSQGFTTALTLKCVVFPNLDDASLQDSYGVVGAEDLLKAMLTPGELTDLHMACQAACDYDSGMNDKIKNVKN